MGAWEDGFAAGYRAGLREGPGDPGEFRSTRARRAATPRKAKRTRKPSAYNRYMSKELKKLRRKHPRTAQATLFKRAAKGWKRKKGKR